jgi:biopolymer transport protein ExbD
MKITRREYTVDEGDMTPMIDMVFQLIAFFLFNVNLTEAEQDSRIQLPQSELAIPPENPFEEQLTLQVTHDGYLIFAGEKVPVSQLKGLLGSEKQILERHSKSAADCTIIIRSDGRTKTGVVQGVIKDCQDVGFERFALRAMQTQADTPQG